MDLVAKKSFHLFHSVFFRVLPCSSVDSVANQYHFAVPWRNHALVIGVQFFV